MRALDRANLMGKSDMDRTNIEVRKWAAQMALALTEDERSRMGGVIDAAKALETYVLGPLAPEGR